MVPRCKTGYKLSVDVGAGEDAGSGPDERLSVAGDTLERDNRHRNPKATDRTKGVA